MSGTRGGCGRIVAMGFGLALALLLLVAGEARAGKYSGRPVRLARRRRRRLGRHHRRGQVPARLLLRDAGGRRPLRRRPPEELHPRRPADRLRHPLRPLALAGAAGDRDHPGQRDLVARAPRRHRAAHRRRHLGGGFDVFAAAATTDVTPREFVAGFPAGAAGARGPPALRRAESKSCNLEPGSWSALRALTITLEDNAVPARGGGRRTGRREAGGAAPRPCRSRAPTPAAGSASAKPSSTAPASR